MQVARPDSVQCRINVTPLVDVVLVLLIVFMVIAPQLASGPPLTLPTTERPPDATDTGSRVRIAIDGAGAMWIDGEIVTDERFPEALMDSARQHDARHVVIQGDASLTFGRVQRTMLAVESAGFRDVSLIAERQSPGAGD